MHTLHSAAPKETVQGQDLQGPVRGGGGGGGGGDPEGGGQRVQPQRQLCQGVVGVSGREEARHDGRPGGGGGEAPLGSLDGEPAAEEAKQE